MTTYIITCVVLFGFDALCKMLLLGFFNNTNFERTRGALCIDAVLSIGMLVWGLVLLHK